jgi:hypothetical protein
LRSKIVLACAAGGCTHAEIAAELGCNAVTVGKCRNRFSAERLDGLIDAPRPGAARTIGDDVIEAIVVEPSRAHRPMPRTRRSAAWPSSTGSATRRCERSGGRSGSSRGEKTASRCRPIRTWWKRSATWSGSNEPSGGGRGIRR